MTNALGALGFARMAFRMRSWRGATTPCFRECNAQGRVSDEPLLRRRGANLTRRGFAKRPRGVTVSILDSKSSDRGPNPREASAASRATA